MAFTFTFIDYFFEAVYLASPLLFSFILAIFLLGQAVGKLERWPFFDALYWAFITAFTVGYGDIKPLKKSTRSLAVLIALIGIMFTGIVVAITVTTATKSYEKHPDRFERLEKKAAEVKPKSL